MAKKTAKKTVDPKYQTEAEQSVKDTANIRDFAYSGDLPLGKTWAFTISKHRDSTLLEESNYDIIQEDLEKRFPGDVEEVRASHWAVGWTRRPRNGRHPRSLTIRRTPCRYRRDSRRRALAFRAGNAPPSPSGSRN